MIGWFFRFRPILSLSLEIKVVVNDWVNDSFERKSFTRNRITQWLSSMFMDWTSWSEVVTRHSLTRWRWMMRTTCNQNFIIRRFSRKSSTTTLVFLRITIDGARTEISLRREVDADRWDSARGRLIGKTDEARSFNAYLDSVHAKVYEIFQFFISSGGLRVERGGLHRFKKNVNYEAFLVRRREKWGNFTLQEKIWQLVKNWYRNP